MYTKSLCQTELAGKKRWQKCDFWKIRRATPTHISPAALIVFDVCLHNSFLISLYNWVTNCGDNFWQCLCRYQRAWHPFVVSSCCAGNRQSFPPWWDTYRLSRPCNIGSARSLFSRMIFSSDFTIAFSSIRLCVAFQACWARLLRDLRTLRSSWHMLCFLAAIATGHGVDFGGSVKLRRPSSHRSCTQAQFTEHCVITEFMHSTHTPPAISALLEVFL